MPNLCVWDLFSFLLLKLKNRTTYAGNIIKNNRAKAFYLMTVQTYCFHEEKNTWCKVLGGGKEKHLLKINYFDVN